MSYRVAYVYRFICRLRPWCESKPYTMTVERPSLARADATADGWTFEYDHAAGGWVGVCPEHREEA